MQLQDHSVREQIISTASRLFLNQGYNLTGINQIIEEAGVAKASLYYHFSSKEDLCVEYLKRRAVTWFGGLYAYLAEITDPEERLIKTFEYRAIYMEGNDFMGCSYIRIISEVPQRDNKLHKQAIVMKEQQRHFFQQLINQLDYVDDDKKTDLLNTVFLIFDGATVQCQVYKEAGPMDIARKAVIELLDLKKKLQ